LSSDSPSAPVARVDRGRILRVVAWAVTGTLLAYLFWRVPLGEVVRKVESAAWWGVPTCAVLVFVIYFADALAMWKIFGRFAAPLSFRDVVVVRGATYLFALINYAVGQGAIAYFVHKKAGVPVVRGAATVLLVLGTNLVVLLAFSTAGLVVASHPPVALVRVVGIAWAGLASYAVIVRLRPSFLARREVFSVLLDSGLRGHLFASVVRLPHTMALVLFTFSMLRAFGVDVPLIDALFLLPVAFFIAVLPISVQGIGTSQTAQVMLFSHYAVGTVAEREATVLASSLTAQAIAFCLQLAIGLVCVRMRAARQVAPGALGDEPAMPEVR